MSGGAWQPHLAAALAALGDRLPPERVERVWLFPARRVGARESGLAVFAAFCGDDEPDRREVWTLRYEVEAGTRNAPRRDTLLAEGRVPGERISGIIAGVLRRSGERAEPPTAEIDGKSARWEALVRELQVEPADSG